MIKHNGINWRETVTRKTKTKAFCLCCGKLLPPGTRAYRPNVSTNSNSPKIKAMRHQRMCLPCANAKAAY